MALRTLLPPLFVAAFLPAFAGRPAAAAPGEGLPAAIRVEPAGTAMLLVPGGSFRMGSDEGEPDARSERLVHVDPFYVDLTKVTNEACLRFARETGGRMPAFHYYRSERNGPRHRVTGVSREDAEAFAAWARKRLPAETEAERAPAEGRARREGDPR